MITVEKTVLIHHSAQQMFDLVDRCEDYPQFLPWCGETECRHRDEHKTIGTLHIRYHGVRAHFTTENEKEIPHWMKIRLVEGPFRKLEGMWRFITLSDDACKIDFRLSYDFSNRLLGKVIGPAFGVIANSFVDAFVKRADVIYGARS
ncbi:MAG: type II toxin-antitoxin system RatA family toxin [Zoogloeaceae bacterium]|jgi:ribosome-associated toxin RatA of RatAB toxin-antitoxin module|nr:type II toxin-antitoxin system RatA family toxin [Zoogloeaceae bacterium]